MVQFHNHSDHSGCCSGPSHEHGHAHEHSGCACSTAGKISFEKEKSVIKQTFFQKYKEFFVMLMRIVFTAISFFAIGLLIDLLGGEGAGIIHTHEYENEWLESLHIGSLSIPLVLFYLIPYLIIGYDIVWRSIKNILKGNVFDENFLMAIATIGALILGEFGEAIAVMVFYQTGEMFQELAVKKSKKSITDLMDIRPDSATIEKDGTLVQVDPKEIEIGQIILVKPGEKIPLDGTIVEGRGSLDTSALTGESFPRNVSVGEEVLSGCVNLDSVLRIKVTKVFGESTVSKILKMVETSASKKPQVEKFISRFAKYYTPIVVVLGVLLAIVPPLFFGGIWKESIQNALILLVISCPCALVISVPLGFFAGIGSASRNGILVKGGNYLEALSKLETAVFDKTGTLTQGLFTVTAVHVVPFHKGEYQDEQKELELLEMSALAERYSNHPISLSIKNEYLKRTGKNVLDSEFEKNVQNVKEIAGEGIEANVNGKSIIIGNARLMNRFGIESHHCHEFGTIIHISVEKEYVGHIVIADELKQDSLQAIADLKHLGVKKVVMLTGDSKLTGEHIASKLAVDSVHTELLPQDKVTHVEQMMAEKGKGTVGFVGDGINDAPVLALADIGIAMGGMGADAAIEAADIVLMDDNPAKLSLAVRISRKTMKIIKQNIVFALGIKAIVMILSAFGIANMWMAIFADTGVALLAVLNSMRALQKN